MKKLILSLLFLALCSIGGAINPPHTHAQFTTSSGVTAFSGLSGSATCAQLPALTGDVTTPAGSCASTALRTNGVAFTAASTMALPVAVANGGTGTATPAGTAGTGLSVSGSFPNQAYALVTPVISTNGGTGAALNGAASGTYPKSNGATPAVFNASTLAASGTGACASGSGDVGTLNGDAAPTCRAINLSNGDVTGTLATSSVATIASGLTGVLPLANGGTNTATAPTSAQILIGNAGGTAYVPQTFSQDCTITAAGVVTCLKTNNVAFVASATTDTTNAANISSGTLGAARMPLGITATPASGNILVGNAGGTAYAAQLLSGDGTLASTGALTVTLAGGGTGNFRAGSLGVGVAADGTAGDISAATKYTLANNGGAQAEALGSVSANEVRVGNGFTLAFIATSNVYMINTANYQENDVAGTRRNLLSLDASTAPGVTQLGLGTNAITIKSYTVATLPATCTKGWIVSVSDLVAITVAACAGGGAVGGVAVCSAANTWTCGL